jgi:microcystin-dependent protein
MSKKYEPLIDTNGKIKPPRSSNGSSSFLANLASTLLIMGVLGLMSYYAYSSYTYNGTQDIRSYQLEQHLVSNVSLLEQRILSNVSTLMAADMANMDKIVFLGSMLNMSIGDITFLKSINHITGIAENIDLISDCPNIVINNQPGSIHFSLQDVILDVVTTNPMTLSVTKVNGTVSITNLGVLMVDGVYPNPSSGNLNLIGTGMIDVYPDPNSTHTVVVDGTAIVTVLNNLQMEDANLSILISNLTTIINNQQIQINNLQMVGSMIAQALNGTTITFNETLMDLMMMVLMAKSDIAALQARLDDSNNTGVVTGTMVPWTGMIVPDGYLLCDGAEYLMDTYPNLAAKLMTMYCPGGMCTTTMHFRVPDMRGRVPAGKKDTPGSVFDQTMGSTTGVETHILTLAQMPVHNHAIGIVGMTNAGGGHTHQNQIGLFPDRNLFPIAQMGNSNTSPCSMLNNPPFWTSQDNLFAGVSCPNTFVDTLQGRIHWDTLNAGDHRHDIADAGSSNAHPNVQPSLIIQYIIKT